MAAFLFIGSTTAAIMWLALLLLPWQPWRTRERLIVTPAAEGDPGSEITAVIPARNEADHIEQTLAALRAQSAQLRILVVDDQSTDGTAQLASAHPAAVEVIAGQPLPAAWTGKLWALDQGISQVRTPFVLLVDADITLGPGVLAALRQRQQVTGAGLVSVMASLAMASFWERLLLPAFIYFFKLIYPFALANGPSQHFHAAAGGCMLLRSDALEAAGGVESLREAVIDDCTLARRIKMTGYRTWIGLSREVVSTRRYQRLSDTWAMVARTAYTQLGESPAALLACTATMVVSLLVPVAGLLFAADGATRLAAVTALGAMAFSYAPTIRFYGLPWALALTLPPVASLYLAMTWSSAWSSWRGIRARWKDREYAKTVTR
ncbi:MAG: glycosyltransferase [Pseudomonadota bacterium]